MKTFEDHDRRPWQGLMSGLALMLCLSVPAAAFGGGTGDTRGSGGSAGFAGGDETVGTLPSTNSGDGGGSPGQNDPNDGWSEFLSPGGSITLEGSATALLTTISSLRGHPRLDIQPLAGGHQRWTISGHFELALDLDLLASSDLSISVGSQLAAWALVELRGRELGQVALSAAQGLNLPLVELVQNGQVPDGLSVTTVDSLGTATRLSLRRTRGGLVLSQRSAALD